MPGRPVNTTVEYGKGGIAMVFRQTPSIQLEAVDNTLRALKRARLIPSTATAELQVREVQLKRKVKRTMIVIRITPLAPIRADLRTAAYRKWIDSMTLITRVMNSSIQANHTNKKMVARIRTARKTRKA